MLSSVPGLYSQDTSSLPLSSCDNSMSPDTTKWPLGAQWLLVENHCSRKTVQGTSTRKSLWKLRRVMMNGRQRSKWRDSETRDARLLRPHRVRRLCGSKSHNNLWRSCHHLCTDEEVTSGYEGKSHDPVQGCLTPVPVSFPPGIQGHLPLRPGGGRDAKQQWRLPVPRRGHWLFSYELKASTRGPRGGRGTGRVAKQGATEHHNSGSRNVL